MCIYLSYLVVRRYSDKAVVALEDEEDFIGDLILLDKQAAYAEEKQSTRSS